MTNTTPLFVLVSPSDTANTNTPPTPVSIPEPSTTTPSSSSTRPAQPQKTTRPPTYLSDYHCYLATADSSSPIFCLESQTLYHLSHYLTYSKLYDSYKNVVLSISAIPEYQNYSQASNSQVWRDAMQTELEALEDNHKWTMVSLPPEKNILGCKWVYKTKFHADGSLGRYKARLVAKGYTQLERIDYLDTLSYCKISYSENLAIFGSSARLAINPAACI